MLFASVLALCFIFVAQYVSKDSPSDVREITFSSIAKSHEPITDKVTVHGYEELYDLYLQYDAEKRVRLLEIGLGCDMGYGPGASAYIWPKLFPNGEIWFAEKDEACVKNYWSSEDTWHYVTGDQGDREVVRTWIQDSGGRFDFIIDDGGHLNQQIWNSFQELFFHALNPGGVYFIEDLQVGRHAGYHSNGLPHDNSSVVLDVLTEWIDQLVVKSMRNSGEDPIVKKTYKHPLPDEVSRIDCIKDMCAVTKAK